MSYFLQSAEDTVRVLNKVLRDTPEAERYLVEWGLGMPDSDGVGEEATQKFALGKLFPREEDLYLSDAIGDIDNAWRILREAYIGDGENWGAAAIAAATFLEMAEREIKDDLARKQEKIRMLQEQNHALIVRLNELGFQSTRRQGQGHRNFDWTR